jgi:hypothetical protein
VAGRMRTGSLTEQVQEPINHAAHDTRHHQTGAEHTPLSYSSQTGISQRPASHTSPTGLASSVMRTVVSSGNDALNLLFDVASNDRENALQGIEDLAPVPDSQMHDGSVRESGLAFADGHGLGSATPFEKSSPANLPSYPREMLKVWQSCHFIRMGWLSAREAIYYVDL